MMNGRLERLEDDDEIVLKSKLSLHLTGSIEVVRARLCTSALDAKPVGENLLYLELPSGIKGGTAKKRIY